MPARQTMIGPYGPWAAKRVGDQPAALSLRSTGHAGAAKFKSLAAWRRAARAKVLELLAQPRDPWTPKARVEARHDHDGLRIEELSWQLPYGHRTRAVFLKPRDARGKLPAIVALHDHGGNKFFGVDKITRLPGPQHPLMKYHHEHYYSGLGWANEVARRGYAVLVHDAFAFASRRVRVAEVPEILANGATDPAPGAPDEAIQAYNTWAGGHEHILAKSLFAAGTTWPGVFLYEDQRALDYLCSRPDVDATRVGCGGLSGGGLRTVFLAGLDERIKVGVDVGFMTTWRDQLLNKCRTHTWMAFVPLLPNYLDWPEVLGLRVPAATMVLNDSQDQLYTPAEMKRADRILRSVFAKAGAPKKYRCRFYEGPHKFDAPMQRDAFEWFDQWLK